MHYFQQCLTCIESINGSVSYLQQLSESVFIGIAGSTKLFCTDLRLRGPTTVNYFEYIDTYRNRRGNEELNDGRFYSLSSNKTNPYEFAVGTNYNVKIFDLRQMKPRYEIHHCLNRKITRGNNFHVSWSTNGKYIFIKDEEVMDRKKEELCFFWDVHHAERIVMPNKTRPLIVHSFNPNTWIDDHLIVSSEAYGVNAISPFHETKKIEERQINDQDELYMGRFPRYMAYNEKTLQLAGGLWQKIFIYSHYKLPPYPEVTSIN